MSSISSRPYLPPRLPGLARLRLALVSQIVISECPARAGQPLVFVAPTRCGRFQGSRSARS
jgi:hypothetical protein